MASILLAEDDSSLRTFLSKALGKAGHMVTSCEDGVEAIAALELREYDLLLADIVMPGIDGIELAQRATAHLPDIKVLFITGFAAVALNAQKTGANRNAKILSKPFYLRELVQEVDRILQDEATRRRHSPPGTRVRDSGACYTFPKTIKRAAFSGTRAISSAGEHFVDIEGVAGSIPASPTIFFRQISVFSGPRVRFDRR